jgi:hypothetical protein
VLQPELGQAVEWYQWLVEQVRNLQQQAGCVGRVTKKLLMLQQEQLTEALITSCLMHPAVALRLRAPFSPPLVWPAAVPAVLRCLLTADGQGLPPAAQG